MYSSWVKAARTLTAEEIHVSTDGSLVRQAGRRTLLFMVLGHQRTGSTLIASRLNSHSRIRCYEEVFLPWVDSEPSLRGWLHGKGYPQWFQFVPGMRSSFLATLTDSAVAPEDADAIGFKIMYNQMSLWPKLAYLAPRTGRLFEDPAFRRWLRANRVLVIHTLRRNHLKILVSHRLAAESGRFHSRDAGPAKRQIVLPVKGLITRLDLIAASERAARAAIRDLPSIEVWYEDYVGSQGPAYEARLCRALGQPVPPNGLESALTKVSSDDLRDTVRNYDQVAEALKGTRFEPFLM
jgi:LPS sulfotransferase NodH